MSNLTGTYGIIAMLCATAVVIFAIYRGVCTEQTVILFIVALFGAEQLLRAWVTKKVGNGNASDVPSAILMWYVKTGGAN